MCHLGQVQLVLRVQALQDRQEHARDGGQLRDGITPHHAAHPPLLQHRPRLRQGMYGSLLSAFCLFILNFVILFCLWVVFFIVSRSFFQDLFLRRIFLSYSLYGKCGMVPSPFGITVASYPGSAWSPQTCERRNLAAGNCGPFENYLRTTLYTEKESVVSFIIRYRLKLFNWRP